MKNFFLFSFLALLGLNSAPVGAAVQRLDLHFNDRYIQGEDTLRLRQEIQNQYPQLDLRRARLQRVMLVAKSEMGHGRATLIVGNWRSQPMQVRGNPQDFNNPQPQTFDRLNFVVGGDSLGVWQIQLQGRIIARRAVLEIDDGNNFNPPPPPPGNGRICFFEHINFGGGSFCLANGQQINNLANYAGWNDKISSVTVEGHVSAVVCVDSEFRGPCITLDRTMSELFSLGNWNDQISSIRVSGFGPPPPPVNGGQACFFEHINFGGGQFCLNEGQQIDNLGNHPGWNDVISSILVRGRVQVLVCEHARFGGQCTRLVQDNSDLRSLGDFWNDRISSIRLERY